MNKNFNGLQPLYLCDIVEVLEDIGIFNVHRNISEYMSLLPSIFFLYTLSKLFYMLLFDLSYYRCIISSLSSVSTIYQYHCSNMRQFDYECFSASRFHILVRTITTFCVDLSKICTTKQTAYPDHRPLIFFFFNRFLLLP